MCDSAQGSLAKSHENTSAYVDTVTLFSKTWTKGHWPLDDLWSHVCWGHMCDCTQGLLCPSLIHQCMWIRWSILQNTTYYIHTTYYVQNEWSHSLFLNSSGDTKTIVGLSCYCLIHPATDAAFNSLFICLCKFYLCHFISLKSILRVPAMNQVYFEVKYILFIHSTYIICTQQPIWNDAT